MIRSYSFILYLLQLLHGRITATWPTYSYPVLLRDILEVYEEYLTTSPLTCYLYRICEGGSQITISVETVINDVRHR